MSKYLTKQLQAAISALPEKTAEAMAHAAHKVLRDAAREEGQNPDIEVFIRKPGEGRHHDMTDCWCVAWEAGPYDWAIPASFAIIEASGKCVEPYYGFDLSFYPSQDK